MTWALFGLGPTELIILLFLLLVVVVPVVLLIVLFRSAGRRRTPTLTPAPMGPQASAPADELARLAALHQQGHLTDEEYAKAKQRVLE